MAKTVQDIMNFIRDNGIKMVDFKMVDINGQYRHVTIPAENFSEDTMKSGIGFDASNYGYAVVEKSDMVFIPDPNTAVIDPFCQIPTLSMTGDAMIIDAPSNRPLPQYPRNIIRAPAGSCNIPCAPERKQYDASQTESCPLPCG